MGCHGLSGKDCKERFEELMNDYIDAVEKGRQAETVPFFHELDEISKMTEAYLAPSNFQAPPVAPWASLSSSDSDEGREEAPAGVLGKRRRGNAEETVTLDGVV